MKKTFLILSFLISLSYAKAPLVDCDQIFELRKDELLREMERIDERQQEFEAYQEASKTLIDQKNEKLSKKLDELNVILKEIEDRKKEILEIHAKNRELLEQIKVAKDDKVRDTYLKMKDKKAATILDKMAIPKAAAILFTLTPKKISKVMAKMDPNNASKVTLLLKAGPPFDNNITK